MVCLDRQEKILDMLEAMLTDNKEFHQKVLMELYEINRRLKTLSEKRKEVTSVVPTFIKEK